MDGAGEELFQQLIAMLGTLSAEQSRVRADNLRFEVTSSRFRRELQK